MRGPLQRGPIANIGHCRTLAHREAVTVSELSDDELDALDRIEIPAEASRYEDRRWGVVLTRLAEAGRSPKAA